LATSGHHHHQYSCMFGNVWASSSSVQLHVWQRLGIITISTAACLATSGHHHHQYSCMFGNVWASSSSGQLHVWQRLGIITISTAACLATSGHHHHQYSCVFGNVWASSSSSVQLHVWQRLGIIICTAACWLLADGIWQICSAGLGAKPYANISPKVCARHAYRCRWLRWRMGFGMSVQRSVYYMLKDVAG
jgi:hypothetical protein